MQIEMDTLQHFNGKITTEDMQLGLLLDNPNLGLLTANAQIKGNPSVFNIDSHINTLEYKSNAYKDIDISGNYNNGDIAGRLKVDNPFIQTDIEGELKRAKRTAIRLNGRISHINPKALNLTDQWGNTRFSGIIDADFIASSLNDAEGSINLRDFDMVTHDSINDTYHLHALQITSGYDEGNHFITVKGDMGEAHIHGKIDWNTLNQSFINYTASKLPTLPGLPRKAKKTDNHFTADLRLTDSNWLNHIFNIPLEIERPLTFRFSLDDTQNQINLLGRAPIISYEGKRYSNAQIDITTDVDTMRYDVKVTKEMDDGGALDLNLSGQAVDNNLSTSLLWNNNAPSRDSLLSMHGVINTITQLYENEEGKAEAHIRVLPSRMMVHGTPWTLEPCDILYSSKRLMVDHFSLNHNKQHLIMKTKSPETCRYDIVSLGEIMLRLDPGEGRIHTTRSFNVWEGGGEYNVARGLRKCFGKRAAVVTAFADNPVGRLIEDFIMQGGVDTSLIKWIPFDGVGRTVRNGLNFTERGFGVRGAVGCSDRGHTAASQLKAGDVDWDYIFGKLGVRWLHTGGIFAALSDTTPGVVIEALKAAKKYGTMTSYDLNYRPSLWKAARRERHQAAGVHARMEPQPEPSAPVRGTDGRGRL